MSAPVITRFAPSPTGFLHIGGARTALFNWLYAKHTGGKILLRIEDTDRERSTEEAMAAILDGLEWMGLTHDGPVIYQFARTARHQDAVAGLLAQGKAYYCYTSAEELQEMREAARREGRPPRYDGRWRDRNPQEAPVGVKPVVRLRAPQTGETVVEDKVQGRVTFQNKDLDDLVLLRSDGTPTYMLAVVVDDHDMGVTHIIRGDDHLTNAARQLHIYQAFGWDAPMMAHIPLIHGADGAKLSKRHGALGVDAYRAMGYLPEALRNYLLRLGWSQGDRETFSEQEMIEAFSLSAIGRSPSRFDFAKLEHMNAQYLRNMPAQDVVARLKATLDYLPNAAILQSHWTSSFEAQLLAAMSGIKERAKTLVDIVEGAAFLVAARPLEIEESGKAILEKGGRIHLANLLPSLAIITDWNVTTTESAVRAYAQKMGIKLGEAAQPLRVALTGRTTSPGIFDVLNVLGQEESLGRLRDQII
jgi:glutamyl-tRNA synthetase